MDSSHSRWSFVVFGLLALGGLLLGWDKGRLPAREPAAVEAVESSGISPDLALYRDVIHEVRQGGDYYHVAREKIPAYGFPVASPLNWRLPTYAWLLSCLPNKCWIQLVLLLLGLGGMWLTFVANCQQTSVGLAALTTFLMFGVMRWTFDGYAYLAQEVWAAVLIVISLAAGALANEHKPAAQARGSITIALSIATGILALFFRELTLPYCLVAGAMAAWKRRWFEATAWTAGIIAFFAFFAWHVGQVKAQLAGMELAAAGGSGLSQWLRFGGLDFVLLTTRMNSLLFAAPTWLLWGYVLLALVGLSRSRDESSQIACLAALLYLLAFAIVGRPENFYWGLLPAPLLAWGAVPGLTAIAEIWGRRFDYPRIARQPRSLSVN